VRDLPARGQTRRASTSATIDAAPGSQAIVQNATHVIALLTGVRNARDVRREQRTDRRADGCSDPPERVIPQVLPKGAIFSPSSSRS
jgi:hypothetical protein